MKVSVSVLKEYDNLVNAISKVNDSIANYLHIDVMDGIFVDNVKFPLDVCENAIKISRKKTDVHLMVNDEDMVRKYAQLKPDMLTFHVEILNDASLIDYVKSLGIEVGLAINPQTDINTLIPYLDKIDLVLFMSVEPGLGGQPFKYEVIDKIKSFNVIKPNNVIVSIDGGVNDETIKYCKEACCDMVVAGSYITSSNNYDDNISKLI